MVCPRKASVVCGFLCALAVVGAASAIARSASVEIVGQGYRGAVLRVDPAQLGLEGDGWIARFSQSGAFRHESPLRQEEDGILVAEIIDLMFNVGAPIDVAMVHPNGEPTHSLPLRFDSYFPWIDWMLQEPMCAEVEDKFRHRWPDCYNGMEAHSSWDFHTRAECPVYASSPGEIIYAQTSSDPREVDVCLYNPYVGGILQYGHVRPAEGIEVGTDVEAGELIGYVVDYSNEGGRGHIHFSVFRPAWEDRYSSSRWRLSGFRRMLGTRYYQDPFYFHEPTTWGYWNLGTLPDGLAANLKSMFARHNPGVRPGSEDAIRVREDRQARSALGIDGESSAFWSSVPLTSIDPASDGEPAGADITNVYATIADGYLCMRMDMAGQPDSGQISYGVSVAPRTDPPSGGMTPLTVWTTSSKTATASDHTGSQTPGVVAGVGDVVEIAVPIAWLGDFDILKLSFSTFPLGEPSSRRLDLTTPIDYHIVE